MSENLTRLLLILATKDRKNEFEVMLYEALSRMFTQQALLIEAQVKDELVSKHPDRDK